MGNRGRGQKLDTDVRAELEAVVEGYLLTGGSLTLKRVNELAVEYDITPTSVWNIRKKIIKMWTKEGKKLTREDEYADIIRKIDMGLEAALENKQLTPFNRLLQFKAKIQGHLEDEVLRVKVEGAIAHQHDHTHRLEVFTKEDFAAYSTDELRKRQAAMRGDRALVIDGDPGAVVDKPNGGNGGGRPLLEMPEEEDDGDE